MRIGIKAIVVGGAVMVAGWIGWGLYSSRTVESIPYEHRETIDGVELRAYPETVLVETTAPNQRAAFRRLFDYISGANQADESISMTAPVETAGGTSISMTAPVRSASADESGDGVRMAFYLPPEYGPDRAPVPTDSNVRLVVEPPKTVAVDQFSWYAPEWRVRRHARKLRTTLDREGIDARGDCSLLRYNDPWTPPFLRRNEVAIDVADEGSPIEIRG